MSKTQFRHSPATAPTVVINLSESSTSRRGKQERRKTLLSYVCYDLSRRPRRPRMIKTIQRTIRKTIKRRRERARSDRQRQDAQKCILGRGRRYAGPHERRQAEVRLPRLKVKVLVRVVSGRIIGVARPGVCRRHLYIRGEDFFAGEKS